MTRLLNTLLIFASMLLGTPLYAKLPADSLLDRYAKGLQIAIEQKVNANKTATRKDYLLVYEDPKFRTDFVNNGRDFWFTEGSAEETNLHNLINKVQGETGGEPLYVVLGSIYNYANLEDVNQHITWSAKDKYKPAAADDFKNDDIRKRILPALGNKKGTAGSPYAVLYVISYFTVDKEGYKVSHRCFYESAYSLKENGFVIRAADKVETSNTPETDLKNKRVRYLESTIKAVTASMAQFSEELKKVNALFAQLQEGSLGKKFYNDYNGVCKDQLVLKKLALLINEIGLDTYNAYVGDKNEADSYDAVVFRAFYNNLKKFSETYKNVSKQLKDVKSGGELASILKALTSSELGALPYPERIKSIRLLNQLATLSDDTWWVKLCEPVAPSKEGDTTVVAGSEQLMISLIGSTPDSQVPSLKADLKGTDGRYSLLVNIFENMDDEGAGDNNYSLLIQELAVLLVRNTTAEELDDIYAKNRLYTWNNGVMRTIIEDENNPETPTFYGGMTLSAPRYLYFQYTPEFSDRYKVSLKKYGAIDLSGEVVNGQPVCTSSCRRLIPITEGSQALDPFDFIAIIPEKDINFNTGFGIEARQVALVPAFFLQWYSDKKNNAAIKSNVKLGVNLTLAAVSVASGAGAFVTAATWGARILIAAETFFTITALASAQYPELDILLRDNLGNVGYAIFKSVEFGVNMYSGLKGAAALGKGAYNAAQRLSNNLLNLLKNRPDILARLQQGYPDLFAKLAAWFKNFNGTNLASLASGEGKYAAFLEKKIVNFKVEPAPLGGTQVSRFEDISNAFVEPGASIVRTPGLPGGSGGTNALVIEMPKASAGVKMSKGLVEQLKANYGAVDESIVTLVEATEAHPNIMSLLTSAQSANNVATVQVLANAAATSKVVIAESAKASYVLYAQGAAKTEVEEYVKKLQQCDRCPEEPMICLLYKVADCNERGDALAKLCGLPHSQREPVCLRLSTYGKKLLNTFLTDLVVDKPGPQCKEPYKFLAQNVRYLTPGIVAAWENYHDAHRTCLRISLDHLRKMDDAWSNPRVRQAPFSFTFDDFMLITRAAGSAGKFTAKIDNTIFDNIQSFCRLNAVFLNMAKLKEKLQQENSGAALEGTNFTIKYLGEHANEFNQQVLQFEDEDVSSDREIDVSGVNEEGLKVYYEFKSVDELSDGYDATAEKAARIGFVDQFTRDLRNATIIDQIIWIFDKDKITTDSNLRTQILNKLKSKRGKELLNSLTPAKKQYYFERKPTVVGDLTDAEIEGFISRNFTRIFRRG